ncbi:hypothetical protein PG997_009484 [Apiospora hydei]|uniref:Uncharacterized protein n=1 Tax=Apiospora hydei TaxID=1337664 RepID=A0ABR1VU92_9PEZI
MAQYKASSRGQRDVDLLEEEADFFNGDVDSEDNTDNVDSLQESSEEEEEAVESTDEAEAAPHSKKRERMLK